MTDSLQPGQPVAGHSGELAVAVARTEVFASPPGVATAFASEEAADLPAEMADHRQALLAIERTGGYMHGLEREVWGAAAPPEPARRHGRGGTVR